MSPRLQRPPAHVFATTTRTRGSSKRCSVARNPARCGSVKQPECQTSWDRDSQISPTGIVVWVNEARRSRIVPTARGSTGMSGSNLRRRICGNRRRFGQSPTAWTTVPGRRRLAVVLASDAKPPCGPPVSSPDTDVLVARAGGHGQECRWRVSFADTRFQVTLPLARGRKQSLAVLTERWDEGQSSATHDRRRGVLRQRWR